MLFVPSLETKEKTMPAKKPARDDHLERLIEFKEAFEKLTRSKGWTLNQYSHQVDDEGAFYSVTLRWQRPSAIDAPL